MLSRVNSDDTFLKRIITGDETWVYGYDMETKKQSSQWIFPGESRPKKARQCRSNVKVLLIASNNGLNVGGSALHVEGTILKGAMFYEL